MASFFVMTLVQALNRIHALLESDTETPMDGPDYLLRVALVNDAVEEWAEQSDTRWREMYELDTSNTGDGSTVEFGLPSNFLEMNGPVLLQDGDIYLEVTPVHVSRAHQFAQGQPLVCWLTGDSLVFSSPPGEGTQIHIPYYRRPQELRTNTQRLPMSRPRYAVYYTVARLTEQSGDYTRYNTNMAKAEELLNQMKIDNQNLGEGVPDTIPLGGYGFGV